MKIPYDEGLSSRIDPESGVARCKAGDDALTEESAGRVLSRESNFLRSADAVRRSGRPHRACRYRETCSDSARSETPSTYGNTLRGNREILCLPAAGGAVGRVGKPEGGRRR